MPSALVPYTSWPALFVPVTIWLAMRVLSCFLDKAIAIAAFCASSADSPYQSCWSCKNLSTARKAFIADQGLTALTQKHAMIIIWPVFMRMRSALRDVGAYHGCAFRGYSWKAFFCLPSNNENVCKPRSRTREGTSAADTGGLLWLALRKVSIWPRGVDVIW